MMKLYQEHKVNPMASCLPLVAQMPVFLIMFRVLHGLTYKPRGAALPVASTVWRAFGNDAQAADPGFIPRYLPIESTLYKALFSQHSMPSLGIDLSKSAATAISDGFSNSIVYVLLVVVLGGLYFVQNRMVTARPPISPTMSQSQQKLMQYLPVAFAVFQVFFLAALVVYYICQTLLRIAQQMYITKVFYGHDEALGRQAQRAGQAAREESAKSGESTGLFGQAKRDSGATKDTSKTKAIPAKSKNTNGSGASTGSTEPAKESGKKTSAKASGKQAVEPPEDRQLVSSKRVTPPKNRPTPSTGAKGRPTPSRARPQTKSSRPKSSDA
jgi:YidC/Oxa1 family membrane protein insertase